MSIQLRWTPKSNQKYLKFRKSRELGDAVGGVAEDGENPAGDAVAIDEGRTVDAIVPGPGNGEAGLSVLDMDRFGLTIASQSSGQPLGVQQPGITGVGGKQCQRTDTDKTSVV
jgi:hypothetical protein